MASPLKNAKGLGSAKHGKIKKTGYAVLFTALFLTIVTWLTVWFF